MPRLPSRSKTLVIAVKYYAKSDINILCSCPVLFGFLTFFDDIFCQRLEIDFYMFPTYADTDRPSSIARYIYYIMSFREVCLFFYKFAWHNHLLYRIWEKIHSINHYGLWPDELMTKQKIIKMFLCILYWLL